MTWLVDTGQSLKTSDGKAIKVMEYRHANDAAVLSAWAKHFRNQYCDDNQIDSLRKGTKLSRAEYLNAIKFPDAAHAPGPSIRAGDFGEVLVADYLEFVLGYWLPRTRYDHKAVRDESTKGTDIVGFKVLTPGTAHPNDILALFEVKAQLTGTKPNGRLQEAINHSGKDELRKAESLNAMKQRFLDKGQVDSVAIVERFQDPEDRPYKETYGAVALVATTLFDTVDITAASTAAHPHGAGMILIVIHGAALMELVHQLYKRAADEA